MLGLYLFKMTNGIIFICIDFRHATDCLLLSVVYLFHTMFLPFTVD